VADVIVTFSENSTEERRQAVLGEVKQWSGVAGAGPLSNNAAAPAYRRFSYVRVADVEAERIARDLRDIPDVETVELAPKRGLAAG
jgi:hypothetical protein